MNTLKKIQKTIASKSGIKEELSRVHMETREDGEMFFTATNGHICVEIKVENIQSDEKIMKKLPKKISFEPADVLDLESRLKEFSISNITYNKEKECGEIIYFKDDGVKGILRYRTDLEGPDLLKLYPDNPVDGSGDFNHKYIQYVANLVSYTCDFEKVEFKFSEKGGILHLKGKKGRGLIMPLSR